jgi:hypothetical protein
VTSPGRDWHCVAMLAPVFLTRSSRRFPAELYTDDTIVELVPPATYHLLDRKRLIHYVFEHPKLCLCWRLIYVRTAAGEYVRIPSREYFLYFCIINRFVWRVG